MKSINLLIFLIIGLILSTRVKAQLVPDSTLKMESSTVNAIDETNDRIDDGAVRGINLFHSFAEFNVNEGRGVFFNLPVGVQNIITRVTGNNISNILGQLGVLGEANLFLINPNGIIFGENASLDIKGSFVSTTANALQFGKQGFFSATSPEAPPLLTIQPSALFFNQVNSGAIINNSIATAGKDPIGDDIFGLRVSDGSSLLLIGGDVILNGGKLQARGGRIELGGLQEKGVIELNMQSQEINLVFPTNTVLSNVSLKQKAELNVRGADKGSIAINAQNLDLIDGSLLLAGINKGVGSINSQAGNIDISVMDQIKSTNNNVIVNSVPEGAIGNAGNININTGSLLLIDNSRIGTITFGQGNAGDVNLTATNSIDISNGSRLDSFSAGIGNAGDVNLTATNSINISNNSTLDSSIFGIGNAGNINLTARNQIFVNNSSLFSDTYDVDKNSSKEVGSINLAAKDIFLDNGSKLSSSTFGTENAGNINLTAGNLISVNGEKDAENNTAVFSSVGKQAAGDGGKINITTGSLFLKNGGQLNASTFGQGNAGEINIEARDVVSFDGVGSGSFESGVFSVISSESTGNSGIIKIETNSLSLNNSAVINTSGIRDGGEIIITANNFSASNGGQVFTTSLSNGNAGNITLNISESLNLSGVSPIDSTELEKFKNAGSFSGLFSNTGSNSTGNGGTIRINGSDSMTLAVTDKARISVESKGQGNAGNLFIQANSIALENGASLLASTPFETGGNITLQINDILTLRNNSTISAQATNEAKGGNVNIDADFIIASLNQNNDIIARAEQGKGGNINITTEGIFGLEERLSTPPNTTNDIDASSDFGLDGTVEINTPNVDPNRGLIQLPTQPLETEVAQACTPGSSQGQSEFFITGRGGLPPTPFETLSSDAIGVDLVTLDSDEAEKMEGQGDTETGRHGENLELTMGSYSQSQVPSQIIEAQGMIVDENGDVVLVASVPNTNSPSSWQNQPQCHKK